MPDVVRAKLAEALRDQHAMAYDDDAAMYYCDCGMATGDYRVWADHMVDVLLSLEGVTIVALPEPNSFMSSWTHFGPVAIFDQKPGLVTFGTGEWLSPGQSRYLAAALLAAADAAEAVTDA